MKTKRVEKTDEPDVTPETEKSLVTPEVSPEQEAREAAERDQQFREQMDSLLKDAQKTFDEQNAASSYTLAQLLGTPQPYEPIPGLFFTRPKMGRKMEVSRRFDAIQAQYRVDEDDNKATADNIALLLPYMHVEGEGGALRHPTAQEAMYEVFEDGQEIVDFYLHIMTTRRAQKEEAAGNA